MNFNSIGNISKRLRNPRTLGRGGCQKRLENAVEDVNHHNACDCRERQFAQIAEENQRWRRRWMELRQSFFDYATNSFAGTFYQENNPFEGFGDYSFSGWDGEDAVPIREKVLTDAKSLISNLPKKFRYPDAAPGIDGSVCMEWLIGEKEIFIDFNSDGSVLIYADINGKKYKNGFSRFDNGTLEYILSILNDQ